MPAGLQKGGHLRRVLLALVLLSVLLLLLSQIM